jgi:hypothetical protein
MPSAVNVREMGDISVSIGTSFAIQSLFNKHPDKKPEKYLPAARVDGIYINVRTLLRNMFNATETSRILTTKPKDYLTALKSELTDIKAYIDSQEGSKLKVYFYLPTYASLHKEFGKTAELRIPKTDLQKQKLEIEKEVFGKLEQELLSLDEDKRYVNITDMGVKPSNREIGLLLTHYPVDLLYSPGFSKLLLIESHTGQIKGENEWYTKFSATATERIPFNKAMLTFFGDSGGMFKPQHHKARDALMSVADKYKWTYQTTRDKIILNLKLGGEGVIEQTVRKMFG